MFNDFFSSAIALRNDNLLFSAKKRVLAAMIFAGAESASTISDVEIKRQVLKHVVRKIAEEFPNTSKWCTSTLFISKTAISILEANGMTVLDLTDSTKTKKLGLIHEHGLPNSVFYEFALALIARGGSISEMEIFLSNNFTVIATVEEGKLVDLQGKSKMPHGWIYGDEPFARYSKAGLMGDLVLNTWYYKN